MAAYPAGINKRLIGCAFSCERFSLDQWLPYSSSALLVRLKLSHLQAPLLSHLMNEGFVCHFPSGYKLECPADSDSLNLAVNGNTGHPSSYSIQAQLP